MRKKVEQIACNPKTNADVIKNDNSFINTIRGNQPYEGNLVFMTDHNDDDGHPIGLYYYLYVNDRDTPIAEIESIIYETNTDYELFYRKDYWNCSDHYLAKTEISIPGLNSFSSYGLELDIDFLNGDTYIVFNGDESYYVEFRKPSSDTFIAYAEDIPRYRHTITLTSSTKTNIMFTFTTPKKDNTKINSLTDLITNLGNTSIQGMGSDGTNTLAYLHIGTSATDTYFKTTNNQQVTLANSGFTNVADEVTTIS